MTIACGQVFWFVSMKWHSLTGGEDGLLNIHRPELAARAASPLASKTTSTLFYFVVAIFAVCIVFVLWRLVHSPFGKALQAIRMNETRARFVGYDVWLTKWTVITMLGRVRRALGRALRDRAAEGVPRRDERARRRASS